MTRAILNGGEYREIASACAAQRAPVPRIYGLGDPNIPLTSGDVLVTFDPSKNDGWHLGGIKKGSRGWLWQASPAVTSSVPLDGLGSFDIGDGVNYPGNTVNVSGHNIFYGYHGEFWNETQAGQFMHFYDDGLFIGQFGETGEGHEAFEITVPGKAGNNVASSVVEVNDRTYLWTNDESQHGPQRWSVSGLQTIRETSATSKLGQEQILLVPSAEIKFPINVKVQPGDACVSLTWTPMAGATGYNIRMASKRGDSGVVVASDVHPSKKTLNNLTNGKTCWFSVSAITSGVETVYSEPVSTTPASLVQMVGYAGSYEQPGRKPDVLKIWESSPSLNTPALRGLNLLSSDLTLNYVGSTGWKIFRWDPETLSDESYFPEGDRVEVGEGWKAEGFLGWQFEKGGVTGTNSGLAVKKAGDTGLIDITPAGTGMYYLTVIMPDRFRESRHYRISLRSRSASKAAASQEVRDKTGINRLWQFRFQGPVTLEVKNLSGVSAVQAIFLDRIDLI